MAIVEGKAYWASITVPNTNFDHVYTVNLVVDKPTADDFKSRGFTIKDMEEGPALIIKRKVHGPNGMIRPAPKLVDKFKNFSENYGFNRLFKNWFLNPNG